MGATTLDEVLASGDGRLCRAVFDLLDASDDGTLSAKDLHVHLGISLQQGEQVLSEAISWANSADREALTEKKELSFPAFLSLLRTSPSIATDSKASKESPAPDASLTARLAHIVGLTAH